MATRLGVIAGLVVATASLVLAIYFAPSDCSAPHLQLKVGGAILVAGCQE